MEKRQLSPAEDREEGAEEVEKSGEVKHVGPEEYAARGSRAKWETEEPLKRGGLVPVP